MKRAHPASNPATLLVDAAESLSAPLKLNAPRTSNAPWESLDEESDHEMHDRVYTGATRKANVNGVEGCYLSVNGAGALGCMDPIDVSSKCRYGSYRRLHGQDQDDVHLDLAARPSSTIDSTPASHSQTSPPPGTLVHTPRTLVHNPGTQSTPPRVPGFPAIPGSSRHLRAIPALRAKPPTVRVHADMKRAHPANNPATPLVDTAESSSAPLNLNAPRPSNAPWESSNEESDDEDNTATHHNPTHAGIEQPKGIKVVHWNAQGANIKLGLLAATIRKKKIDVMMVQDTRLSERGDGRPPLKMKGFHVFHKPRSEDCHGLLTIIRSSIPAKEQVDVQRPGTLTEVLTVKIWLKDEKLLLHNLYRTGGEVDLAGLLDTPTPAFMGCDINAQHILWHTSSNTAGRRIMRQLDDLDEYVVLNQNQEPTTTYGTAIDILVLHARLAARCHWGVINDFVSDHFACCTTLFLKDVPPAQHLPRWRLYKADWPQFQKKVNLLMSNCNLDAELHELAENLTEVITQAADDHIPKTSPSRKKRMYWCYDPKVQTTKRALNRATRRFRKQKTDGNKQTMLEAAEIYATTCNTVKNTYWNTWITEANDEISPTQLWRKIKNATGTPQVPPRHPDPVAESNRILTGFVERTSSGQLQQDLLQPHEEKIATAMGTQSRADTPITASEISAVLRNTRQSAPGQDAISYTMMKHAPPAYLTALAVLYSRSLAEGQLPHTWKKAKIVPIPKKVQGTYRPISLLPVQSKLMEKVILRRLQWIAAPPHTRAMGFKRASGTRDTVSTLIHDLTECRARRGTNVQLFFWT